MHRLPSFWLRLLLIALPTIAGLLLGQKDGATTGIFAFDLNLVKLRDEKTSQHIVDGSFPLEYIHTPGLQPHLGPSLLIATHRYHITPFSQQVVELSGLRF